MALTQVTGPYPIFTDLDGSPLDDGYLYIGDANQDPETNPIQVFWDSALTIPATQPIRTNNGYAWRNGTPGLIYTAGAFSITIRNKRNEFVLYSPVGYGFDPKAASASVVKNDFTGNGVETNFTLSASPSTILATNIFINGVYQEKDSYSLLGNVITFSIAPPLGSSIEILTNESGVINAGNANDISYTLNAPGATLQSVQTKLEQYVSVKDFGAAGDGVTDDTAAIQAAINAHRGKIFLPTGTYKISSTLVLKEETILIGEGAGAYFAGTGYTRMTVIQPTATFSGTKVIDIDPANISGGLTYIYGVALRDLLVDCINIKNGSLTILNIASLSNSETFDSVRIINNNSNVGINIGISANASALESDGLSFNNIYMLQADSGGSSTTPLVTIGSANEISFRDSKFQRGSNPATATGSIAVAISAVSGRAVNAVTLDSCSFTGAEVGLLVQGNSADGQGPRWVRVQNCTFEGPKFPIYVSGTATRPAQFNVFGPGNRMISLAAGGTGIVLDAYASNNQVFADDFTTILLNTNSQSNLVYGGNTVTDTGTDNARININTGAVQLNSLYTESYAAPTLLNGWSNAVNRETAGYLKDARGFVQLKGTVTGGSYGTSSGTRIFTLPVGYRPFAAVVFSAAAGNAFGSIIIDGNGDVFPAVGSGAISLDGINFSAA